MNGRKPTHAEFYGWYFSAIAPRQQWHAWFAWRPVSIKGKRVWLKHIRRDGIYATNYKGQSQWKWRYAMREADQTSITATWRPYRLRRELNNKP